MPCLISQILSHFQKMQEVQKDGMIWGILAMCGKLLENYWEKKYVGNYSVFCKLNDIISNLWISWVFP